MELKLIIYGRRLDVEEEPWARVMCREMHASGMMASSWADIC